MFFWIGHLVSKVQYIERIGNYAEGSMWEKVSSVVYSVYNSSMRWSHRFQDMLSEEEQGAFPWDPQRILTKAQYEAALNEISPLIELDPEPSSKEGKRVKFLGRRIEEYERRQFPEMYTVPEGVENEQV
jgi:hypothetical protein